jgi:nucleotide-binding universal stress UspA family protein
MFKRLLVPLDRSELAEDALGQATAIARAAHAGVDVVLVHQLLPFGAFGDAPWNAGQIDAEHKYVQSIADELASGASVSATQTVLTGSPAEMICRRAQEVEADLIVMTSHGRTGLSRAWLGSVADGVLRQSSVPVLMLRPLETATNRRAAKHLFKHILVPLDDSMLAQDILASASSLAACTGASVTLLRVVDPVPMILLASELPVAYPATVRDVEATEQVVADAQKEIGRVAQQIRDESHAEIDAQVVVDSSAAHAIIEFARTHEIDVIAMATHGRGASRLLMGSVADKVVRGSGLPVLLHRPAAVAEQRAKLSEPTVAEQLPSLRHV